MREIKFRAWDKTQKRWARLSNLYIPESADDTFTLSQEKYVLVQFTGLKDKNGKEIYEGDVVRQVDGGVAVTPPIAVTYHDQSFLPTLTHLTVVIGNIYENPELLK